MSVRRFLLVPELIRASMRTGRVLDAADPAAMRELASEIGPTDVLIRGVLHVNAPAARWTPGRSTRTAGCRS